MWTNPWAAFNPNYAICRFLYPLIKLAGPQFVHKQKSVAQPQPLKTSKMECLTAIVNASSYLSMFVRVLAKSLGSLPIFLCCFACSFSSIAFLKWPASLSSAKLIPATQSCMKISNTPFCNFFVFKDLIGSCYEILRYTAGIL